jgi:sugar O-acyltransferase (sialic acid O-acetyltransferase NeuD family)
MGALYLCGAGNAEAVRLAFRVNKEQCRWDRIVLLDDDPTKHGESILGVEIAGPFAALAHTDAKSAEVANLVARTTEKRWSARGRIQGYGLPFATLINPDVDTTGVELARDITIYQNAIVGAQATVDDASVIFMGAIVGHGARLGRCCIVGPNAVINARVQLEEGVYVGTNATVLPDLKVGAWATIAAGSVVVRDVPARATVLGVPGKILTRLSAKVDAQGSDTRTTS